MEASIAKILNIEADEKGVYPFYINDSVDNDLYLVHYNEKNIGSTPLDSPLRFLRGTIVSLKKEKIVCASHGYIPTIVVNNFQEMEDTPVDLDGNKHPEKTTGIFSKLIEGSNIRVWQYEGKMMVSTHKKIDATKAYWGNKKSIGELFMDLLKQNPQVEKSIIDAISNDIVGYFILMDKYIVQSTSFPIGMDDRQTIAVFIGFLNTSGSIVEGERLPKMELSTLTSRNYLQYKTETFFDGNCFEFEEKDGYFWLRKNNEGKVSITKVLLDSYKKKLDLVNNEANFLKRSYELLSDARFPLKDEKDDFLERYPIVNIISKDDIDKENPIGSLLNEDDFMNLKNKFASCRRYQLVMMHYANAVTPSRRQEILHNMYTVPMQREKLISKILLNQDLILQNQVSHSGNKNDTFVFNYLVNLIKSAKGDTKTKNIYISNRIRSMTGNFIYTLAKNIIGVN